MSPNLRPMTKEEIATFITVDMEKYVEDRVTAGESREEARRVADSQTAILFPHGSPAPGQLLYQVIGDEGAVVGFLWIGPPMGEEPGAKYWVWNIEIDEPYRGRGLGRAAMELAEDAARSHGATELGLSVFGHNPVARRLYESMGYVTKTVQMRKSL
jgi:ribosomal protein S18 acetylase RimI-like enzyme